LKPSKIFLGLIKIPIDFFLGILAFYLAYLVRSRTDLIPGLNIPADTSIFPALQDYLIFAAYAVTGLVLIYSWNRMYSLKNTPRLTKELSQIIILNAAWLMLIITWFFVIRTLPFSRLVLGYTTLFATILIGASRIFINLITRAAQHYGIGRTTVLFIGNNNLTEKIYSYMKKDTSYKIKGLVDDQEYEKSPFHYLGKITDLEKIIKNNEIEEVIQTKGNLTETQNTDIVEFCRHNHIGYSFVPDLLTFYHTNIDVETREGIPIIHLKPTPLDGWGKVTKRIFDLAGASIGLLILSPIFICTAIAIKIDSKGPVFFTQLDDGSRVKRVGQFGKLFNFFKFRSMFPKTHNLRYTKEMTEQNLRAGTPLVKIKNDPRVTRVGKFIRNYSIDELPQLFSVLAGTMSLVGPRAHLPEEVEKYQKHHKFVLTIKPGCTGLPQISGRSDLDFEQEIKLDSYYIEHWSPWLDTKIILKTFGVLFKGYKE
jgi:exopolysaccharide biosynthesis polyprenyl glycosylphosphotransferase